eukprot:TRINITY_DN11449_c0_g1_i1.p1 TRINITY_DN11449_c0_g1~~TRINITY_DN11449_c0_g1_i1.p1  ORF type:complete len:605 (+),score=136.43 TRINITY_DN11449_c0_g1_i1:18-1832(+)
MHFFVGVFIVLIIIHMTTHKAHDSDSSRPTVAFSADSVSSDPVQSRSRTASDASSFKSKFHEDVPPAPRIDPALQENARRVKASLENYYKDLKSHGGRHRLVNRRISKDEQAPIVIAATTAPSGLVSTPVSVPLAIPSTISPPASVSSLNTSPAAATTTTTTTTTVTVSPASMSSSLSLPEKGGKRSFMKRSFESAAQLPMPARSISPPTSTPERQQLKQQMQLDGSRPRSNSETAMPPLHPTTSAVHESQPPPPPSLSREPASQRAAIADPASAQQFKLQFKDSADNSASLAPGVGTVLTPALMKSVSIDGQSPTPPALRRTQGARVALNSTGSVQMHVSPPPLVTLSGADSQLLMQSLQQWREADQGLAPNFSRVLTAAQENTSLLEIESIRRKRALEMLTGMEAKLHREDETMPQFLNQCAQLKSLFESTMATIEKRCNTLQEKLTNVEAESVKLATHLELYREKYDILNSMVEDNSEKLKTLQSESAHLRKGGGRQSESLYTLLDWVLRGGTFAMRGSTSAMRGFRNVFGRLVGRKPTSAITTTTTTTTSAHELAALDDDATSAPSLTHASEATHVAANAKSSGTVAQPAGDGFKKQFFD